MDKKFNYADYVKYSIIVMIFASIVFKYTNRIKNIKSIKRGLNALIAVKEVTYHVINNRVKKRLHVIFERTLRKKYV